MDTRGAITSLFGVERALIGMVHVQALPGTPRYSRSLAEIRRLAVSEGKQLRDAGFHAIMIENMHDRPYLKRAVGPEVVAAMTVVGAEIRSATGLPLGIQVLAGANQESLAVAQACDACFVRAEGYVFAHTADEGEMEADAGELLRYRRAIDAERVKIFTDVKKKHASHQLTADVDLVDTARAAEFFLADGVVVTGSETGRSADPDEVRSVARAVRIPTLVGSGLKPDNLGRYPEADAFIVGSALKKDGRWSNPLDPGRIESLVSAFAATESVPSVDDSATTIE